MGRRTDPARAVADRPRSGRRQPARQGRRSIDAAVLHDEWGNGPAKLGMDPRRVIEDAVGRGRVTRRPRRDLGPGSADGRSSRLRSGSRRGARPSCVREVAAWCPSDVATTPRRSSSGPTKWPVASQASDASISPSRSHRAHCCDDDGRPVTESAIDRALTTRAILDQERSLIEWADRRFAHDGPDEPAAVEKSDVDLTLPQADAACAVAGYADLVLVVGPAGTGKTTALRPAVEQLRASGRAVFGVAPSATAADVLSEETGVAADTIHKLLIEHTLIRPPDHRYDLPVGATVIVDEAGMLPTDKLAELADLADTRGWRLALVGDPLQFSAVGRGGMFGLMVDTFGAIELDQVHRFEHEWEREASLRLRRGDVSVAEIYDAHHRLHAGTIPQMERAAARRWYELREAGKRELLMTPTNEATERLNERCQHAPHPSRGGGRGRTVHRRRPIPAVRR